MSNASNLSTLANVLDDANAGEFLKSTGSGGVAFDTVAAGAVVYATADLLPLSGFAAGDMAYVTATNRFYINNGSGWYSVSLVNTNPNITSVADASSNTTPFTLATDGTATVITVTAADPEDVPLTYGYSVTTGDASLNGSTVAQGTGSNTNVFTVTPHASQDATFTITFTASDGINQATSANAFSLSFVTVVADSNHTTLLATATGTSDNNNITDSSSNSHSITVNGDAHAGTFSPYRSGGYSTYFDGNGDYLEVSDDSSLQLGTGNFTIEAWVYPTSWSNSTLMTILSKRNSSSTGYWRLGVTGGNGTVSFQTGSSGTEFTLTSPSSDRISLNEWSHIAVTKSGSTAYLYINGSEVATDTNASVNIDFVGKPVRVGTVDSTPTFFWNGYVADARIVKGTVITPPTGGPTERLEAVTNTSLLTCHLPYIADGSTNDHSITVNGNVSTKPFSPYDYDEYSAADHGGSVYFDGSTAYLISDISSNIFSVGTGDFTAEGWFYFPDDTTDISIIGSGISGGFDFRRIHDGTIRIGRANVAWDTTSAALSLANRWCHIAAVRSSGTVSIYVNGVAQTISSGASNTNNYNSSSHRISVGYNGFGSARYGYGNYTDIRLTTSAVYSSNFTPPTAPLSSSGAALHIKGTDASIIDKSQGANLKLVGNTTGSTTQVKFSNTKSMYFDGSGDYIQASLTEDNLPNEFTIEGWVYTSTVSGPKGIFGIDTTAFPSTDAGIAVFTRSSTYNYNYAFYCNGSQVNSTTPPTANSWQHFALVRDSNNLVSLYLDGSSIASSTISGTVNGSIITIGGYYSSSYLWNGHIQDFRITKGMARYTSTFTPPTAPLEG